MVLNGLVGFYPLAGGRVSIIRYLYQKNVRPSLSLCDKTVRVHWFLPCVCGLFAPTHLLIACCWILPRYDRHAAQTFNFHLSTKFFTLLTFLIAPIFGKVLSGTSPMSLSNATACNVAKCNCKAVSDRSRQSGSLSCNLSSRTWILICIRIVGTFYHEPCNHVFHFVHLFLSSLPNVNELAHHCRSESRYSIYQWSLSSPASLGYRPQKALG